MMTDTGQLAVITANMDTLNTSIDSYVHAATGIDIFQGNKTVHDPSEDYQLMLLNVAYAIQTNYLIVLCAIGLPGNMAAVITISTMRPASSAVFLVALLAVSDSVALLAKLVINQLFLSLAAFSDAFCHSRDVVYFCSCFANWVLVIITFERLVVVLLPVVRHRFLSKRRVYCICASTACVLFSIHLPLLTGTMIEDEHACVLSANVAFYGAVVWPWVNVLVNTFIPLLLLLIISTTMCLTLRRARIRRRAMLGVRCHSGTRGTRPERAMTSMMLAAALLFVLMVFPQCLYFILFHHTDALLPLRDTAVDFFTRQVTTLLTDSTHALNFYLYFVRVRRFRIRFLTLLLCRKHRWALHPNSSSGHQSSRSSNRHVHVTNTKTNTANGSVRNDHCSSHTNTKVADNHSSALSGEAKRENDKMAAESPDMATP